jgi:hypothetical protein
MCVCVRAPIYLFNVRLLMCGCVLCEMPAADSLERHAQINGEY